MATCGTFADVVLVDEATAKSDPRRCQPRLTIPLSVLRQALTRPWRSGAPRVTTVSLYDLFIENPPPLVPRLPRRGIHQRVLYDGTVETTFDTDQVEQEIAARAKDGIEAIAVYGVILSEDLSVDVEGTNRLQHCMHQRGNARPAMP